MPCPRRAIVSLSLLIAACADTLDLELFDPGRPALRYEFTGIGSDVRDSAGSAHARAVGGALLAGAGSLRLDGNDDYVELPAYVLSTRSSATIVAWIEWYGGVCWQRVFDFGSIDDAEGWPSNAPMSVFMTPSACSDGSYFAKAQAGANNAMLRAQSPLPQDRLVQVALALDSTRHRAALFLDGVEVTEADMPVALSELKDVHNMLGGSQWEDDPYARIRYEEFRIYDRALSAAQLAHLARIGPHEL